MNPETNPIENKTRREDELRARAYELLLKAQSGQKIIVRDDQHDFSWILDSVKACQKNNRRFSLIDSGRLSPFQMEWLAEAGADIYTSNKARQDIKEVILLNRAAKKGGAITAYLHHGALEGETQVKTFSFLDLKEMGRSGIYLHFSNKEKKHEFSKLNELAYECGQGGGWLVYYHHGFLESALEDLVRSGAWVHVSDHGLQEEADIMSLMNIARAVRSKGTNLILHVEKGIDVSWLKDIFKSGFHVLFKTPPSDYKSPLKAFELAAEKQKLDFRTCYIHANFML